MKKLKILLYFLLAVGVYGLLDAVRASRPVSAFLVAAGIVLVSAGGLFLLYRTRACAWSGFFMSSRASISSMAIFLR